MGKYKVSMSSPDITSYEIESVNKVLNTPILSIGAQIEGFEQSIAEYVNTQYAIGVNSGTAGLHLGIIASGAGNDDLVITTPFSFIASANCILYEGATPVFVDVDPDTGNISPDLISEALHDLNHSPDSAQRWLPRSIRSLSTGKKYAQKAILPVHAFGQPADMDNILKIAREYNLTVLEDACEALGSEYKGRKVGSFGDMSVFAFYPNKQITTGEGGMIVTNNKDWDTLFRSLRNQGRDIFDAWLCHNRLGYNYRMDEMSAALGSAQMKRIDELLSKREQVANWYNERLGCVDGIEIPRIVPNTTRMSWFVYVVRLSQDMDREKIMLLLEEDGIPSRPYFTPIHLQPFYAKNFGYQRGDFPVTEKLGAVSLALPFSSVLSEDHVDYVSRKIVQAVNKFKPLNCVK